jgi:poly(3-hydroxybutyrate) depolymerase
MSSIHVMPPNFTTSIRFFYQPKSQPSISFDNKKKKIVYRNYKPSWLETSQPTIIDAHGSAVALQGESGDGIANREKREGIIGKRSI